MKKNTANSESVVKGKVGKHKNESQKEDDDDKPWDSNLRSLVRADPMAFVYWFMKATEFAGDVTFLGALPEKLKTWKLETDALLKVVINGKEVILHIEFQTYNDAKMAERMLCYNVLIRCEYELPVVSCVIYLLRDGNVPPSPLVWTTPLQWDDETFEILRYRFLSIELGKLSPEQLLALGLPGLLPLLPLTKNGATTEIVELMLQELNASQDEQKEELLTIGSMLAALIFKKENPGGKDWLLRRLRSMRNFLSESPLYQEILAEGEAGGIEKGLAKGREEGLEEGLAKGREEGLNSMRQALLGAVEVRFPDLSRAAKRLVKDVDDMDKLRSMLLYVISAESFDDTKEYLWAAIMDEKEEE